MTGSRGGCLATRRTGGIRAICVAFLALGLAMLYAGGRLAAYGTAGLSKGRGPNASIPALLLASLLSVAPFIVYAVLTDDTDARIALTFGGDLATVALGAAAVVFVIVGGVRDLRGTLAIAGFLVLVFALIGELGYAKLIQLKEMEILAVALLFVYGSTENGKASPRPPALRDQECGRVPFPLAVALGAVLFFAGSVLMIRGGMEAYDPLRDEIVRVLYIAVATGVAQMSLWAAHFRRGEAHYAATGVLTVATFDCIFMAAALEWLPMTVVRQGW